VVDISGGGIQKVRIKNPKCRCGSSDSYGSFHPGVFVWRVRRGKTLYYELNNWNPGDFNVCCKDCGREWAADYVLKEA